jgi:hypothetical protein
MDLDLSGKSIDLSRELVFNPDYISQVEIDFGTSLVALAYDLHKKQPKK